MVFWTVAQSCHLQCWFESGGGTVFRNVVSNHHNTSCNNQEIRELRLHCHEHVKSRNRAAILNVPQYYHYSKDNVKQLQAIRRGSYCSHVPYFQCCQ